VENVQSLMANLTDEQVAEYQTAKYPPSVREWARQEAEARIARREQAQQAIVSQIAEEQAREARKATIAKIAKSLEKVWTDDLTNVLVTREEVEDKEHGEEVEVPQINPDTGKPVAGENGKAVIVKETRYPKVKALVVRTNIYWSEKRDISPGKSGKATTTTKRAITVRKVEGDKVTVVGNFRSGEEASRFLELIPDKGSGNLRLIRNGYMYSPYDGKDFTVAES